MMSNIRKPLMNVVVRGARNTDIFKIIRDRDLPDITSGDFRRLMKDFNLIVAANDFLGYILGYVIYNFGEVESDGNGRITSLFVSPPDRKKGCAAWLLTTAEKKLEELGANKVSVLVPKTNSEALGFFLKMGYEVDIQCGEEDANMMRKHLKGNTQVRVPKEPEDDWEAEEIFWKKFKAGQLKGNELLPKPIQKHLKREEEWDWEAEEIFWKKFKTGQLKGNQVHSKETQEHVPNEPHQVKGMFFDGEGDSKLKKKHLKGMQMHSGETEEHVPNEPHEGKATYINVCKPLTNVVVRVARFTDIFKILRDKDLPNITSGDMRRLMKDENLIVAANDFLGYILGYLIYNFGEVESDGNGRINLVFVSPPDRKKGCATWLLTTAEKKLEELGANKVSVRVPKTNSEALGLFQKMGYELDIQCGEEDVNMMRKDLKGKNQEHVPNELHEGKGMFFDGEGDSKLKKKHLKGMLMHSGETEEHVPNEPHEGKATYIDGEDDDKPKKKKLKGKQMHSGETEEHVPNEPHEVKGMFFKLKKKLKKKHLKGMQMHSGETEEHVPNESHEGKATYIDGEDDTKLKKKHLKGKQMHSGETEVPVQNEPHEVKAIYFDGEEDANVTRKMLKKKHLKGKQMHSGETEVPVLSEPHEVKATYSDGEEDANVTRKHLKETNGNGGGSCSAKTKREITKEVKKPRRDDDNAEKKKKRKNKEQEEDLDNTRKPRRDNDNEEKKKKRKNKEQEEDLDSTRKPRRDDDNAEKKKKRKNKEQEEDLNSTRKPRRDDDNAEKKKKRKNKEQEEDLDSTRKPMRDDDNAEKKKKRKTSE